VTPAELLDAAWAVLRRPWPGTTGLWSRAASLLGRQALEAALDELWSRDGSRHRAGVHEMPAAVPPHVRPGC
jgi:hypothetical protein